MDDISALREQLLVARADITSLRTALTALASRPATTDAALEVFDARASEILDLHREAARRGTLKNGQLEVLALEQAFRHTRLCLL